MSACCLCELIVQSGPQRVACNCCWIVSNVAGQAWWQQGWMRMVWRASAQWWSHHLKPALHLSTELVCFFFLPPSLVCVLLTFSRLSLSVVFCFLTSPHSFSLSLSYLCFFFGLPLSVHFLLSPFISDILNLLFSLCLHLSFSHSVSGPLYQSSQEAVVWDIPVFRCDRLWSKLFYRSLVVL